MYVPKSQPDLVQKIECQISTVASSPVQPGALWRISATIKAEISWQLNQEQLPAIYQAGTLSAQTTAAAAVTAAAAATAPSTIAAEPVAAQAEVQPPSTACTAAASSVRTGVAVLPPAAQFPTIAKPAAVQQATFPVVQPATPAFKAPLLESAARKFDSGNKGTKRVAACAKAPRPEPTIDLIPSKRPRTAAAAPAIPSGGVEVPDNGTGADGSYAPHGESAGEEPTQVYNNDCPTQVYNSDWKSAVAYQTGRWLRERLWSNSESDSEEQL
ncbi:hypothetical protein WJX75_004266 [Coccomyxa subellipsoidea]|uniref:Uncharacterized protein n=1 Tax=Coccomyxa subellipsoidea TaxID=248742 RepID=A0ABR2YVW8_9CHLO